MKKGHRDGTEKPKERRPTTVFSTGIDNDSNTKFMIQKKMLKATAKALLGWYLATTRLKHDLIFPDLLFIP